jgi:hypothetical protein
MKENTMFSNTQFANKTVTVATKDSTVNKFDAASINIPESYIQLPSVKQDASKLKPNAVNEKEKEVAAIVQAVNALESEHSSYVDQYITRGNQTLYAVLAKIYALAVQINHSDNKDSIIKSLRNTMSLQKRIKTQKNSSALTLLVRWVVGGSRQLAHTYSKALSAAYEDNVSADELAAYFVKQGGMKSSADRNTEKKSEVSNVRVTNFKSFLRTADVLHDKFQNTKINWTETVFGDFSGHVIIVGYDNGGGNISGLRAICVSNDAHNKISKILADELFNNIRDEKIESWVNEEYHMKCNISNKVVQSDFSEVLSIA